MADPLKIPTLPQPRWLRAYLDYGLAGLPPRAQRHRRTLNLLSLFVAQSGLAYAAFYLIYDATGLWPAAAVVALFALFLLFPVLVRRNETAAMLAAAGMTIGLQMALAWLLSAQSGLHLFILTVPATAVVMFGTGRLRLVAGITALCVIALSVAGIAFQAPAPFMRVDPLLLGILQASTFFAVCFFVLIGVFVGFARASQAEDALELEHARSEALLYNLLPSGIAARLKLAPDQTIADSLPKVAILFADVVGFTPMSARMSAEEVVEFLNAVFSRFDALAQRHGLEKIKTIGDAYMVGAGMPDPCDDPVHRVAEMALDMLSATRDLPDGARVRIGVHCGPAVAGVIGQQKLFYDVWGETVNTASRMESHGEAGRIQVSAAAYRALEREYRFDARGIVEVKGIGPVETWWLIARR